MATTVNERSARGVKRRALVKGAAWTVPAVLIAAPAPAFAASCTSLYPGTFDWATNYTPGTTSSGGGTMTFSNGRTASVTLSSAFTNYTPTAANLTVTNPVGGTGAAGLTLFHTPDVSSGTGSVLNPYQYYTNDRANSQILTMTFGAPLYNLTFLLTDIDSATGDFIDVVEVSSAAAYTSSTPTGSTVTTGTGAQGSPFRQAGNNTGANNNTGVEGNKRITFAGPVSALQIRYWNAIATNGVNRGTSPDQAMFISGLSASAYNAGC